ncbi:uncharacterized protein LOC6583453 [Drosophila mojavensis]|uniref:Uncharacterized protein n=1 Tax=Drosophila mojavensis TaxID=7230 RepID=B4KWG8_DROMO|nr:uncharacterized protein LOC6583453 [Drosophila mojavensis]EDW19597.1 uncharacterized protein Dmoj_GI11436 [Drosophila mojavensis]
MSANLFALFLIALIANLASAAIVPRLQDNYVQLEPISDNKYTLRINEGGALREETVELIASGEPIVKGQLIQQYASPSGTLTVTYEAGLNGYVAKYSFVSTTEIPPVIGLSPGALKAASG